VKRSYSHLLRAALATVSFVLAFPGAAQAASCSIDAALAVAFGAYDYLSAANTDSAGTITYTCHGGGAQVTLSQGSSGTYAQRTMSSGANQLGYNLYTNAAHTLVWGDSTSGTALQSVGVGTGVNLQVFGSIPTGQNCASGSYGDTIMVTFFF
jgi:spore coat protein U-like protein